MEPLLSRTEAAAVKLDGDTGEPRLETCNHFEWIVAGHQVGAHWQTSTLDGSHIVRHLGGPSPHNAKDSPLCLWIGLDEARNELLVLLTQSVKLSTASRARSRRMFLIVPAESLAIESAAPDFESLALNQVPEALFERPSDARSAYSNGFLHIAFTLCSKQSSKVVMPMRPYERHAQGTALSLLDGLRSLSEARKFNVYLKFNSYARLGLQRMQAKTGLPGSRLTTPTFDLGGMYRGGRDGGFDLWQEQGWRNNANVVDESKSRKRLASHEPGTPPPRFRASDAAPPPAYLDQNDTVLTPAASLQHEFTIVSVPRSCTPEDATRDQFAVMSESSRVVETPRTEPVAPPIVVDTSNTLLPSARFYKDFPMWLWSVWRTCPYAHYMFIHELLTAGAAAKREDADGYHSARVACTHRFISYEAAQRANDDFGQILNSRYVYGHADDPLSDISAVMCEPSSLISWMLIVESTADSALFGLLIELEKRRKHVLLLRDVHVEQLHDDEYIAAERDRRMSRFIDMKSLIVIEVCFQYGARVSESRRDIVDEMSRELTRQLRIDQKSKQ